MKTCPNCGNSFDSDVRFCPRDGAVLRDVAAPEAATGSLIAGRYEIIRELGRGGMGVVYLATHVQMDRRCALKVVLAETLVNPEAIARFHREARSASQISHPNVVSVYDFGETDAGTAYLAMEYVEGRSLDAVLEEAGKLPPRRAARIIWQIANGLNVAHDLKIVHRDLKPANIMLTRYRHWEDFVKVVDFGIAKAFGDPGSKVTMTGLAVGSPGYMSPEQWTGPEVDHRSDIYSLAMIAVRLLAGAAPANKFALPIAGAQILEKIPAAAEWPADLKATLCKGLAPYPEDRYNSVSEFANDFVTAITRWVPEVSGVREPWEERLTPGTATGTVAKAGSGKGPARVGSRAALVGVLGGVAVLGVVGWLLLAKPAAPVSPSPGPRADSLAARPESSGTRLATQGRGKTVSSNPPRGANPAAPAPPPVAPPPAVVPAPGPPVWADSAAALIGVIDLNNPSADSARRVVTRAKRLLSQELPVNVRVDVTYRLAEAQFVLGEETSACAALRQVEPISQRTGYSVRAIQELLKNCQ